MYILAHIYRSPCMDTLTYAEKYTSSNTHMPLSSMQVQTNRKTAPVHRHTYTQTCVHTQTCTQHSPLILLMLFTPPWHFPEDMSQLTSLQSGSCPRHTWWVASVNISTQQCVCNTLGGASKPAMSEAPPAYPSTHNSMARPHSHCTTGPHRTPSI